MSFFFGLQLPREQLCKLLRRGPAAVFDVDQVGREAAQLVPCHDIVRGSGDEFLQSYAVEQFVCDVTEANLVTVTEEPHASRQSGLDRGKSIVVARGGDAI